MIVQFLRWSASADRDYEDEEGDDDDDDGPAPKRLRNDTGDAVKKRKRKPKLPGAGPFNADYSIHAHGLPALKKRKDLNIQADYGDNGQWGRDAGLRELFQNIWVDLSRLCSPTGRPLPQMTSRSLFYAMAKS